MCTTRAESLRLRALGQLEGSRAGTGPPLTPRPTIASLAAISSVAPVAAFVAVATTLPVASLPPVALGCEGRRDQLIGFGAPLHLDPLEFVLLRGLLRKDRRDLD